MKKKTNSVVFNFWWSGYFLLEFISTLLLFISDHPLLGISCISIGGGMLLLTYDE